MNKFIYLIIFLLSVSFISAYSVNVSIPLSVRVMYDNGGSLVNIPTPCRLSVYLHDTESFILRNVSMTPSGAYHTYSFIPVASGSYTASIYCSYLGDASAYWLDFSVDSVPVVPSGSGRGFDPNGGSTLVGMTSSSIVPDRSSYVVNVADDSFLKFSTSYYVDSKLANAQSSSWKLLKDGNIITSGTFASTSVGVYVFSYDFNSLPLGNYQVALSFDGKIILVDVSVVSRSGDLSMISGLITLDDGSVSIVKLGVLFIVLLFIILVLVLLWKSINKKPPQQRSSVPTIPRQ
jgi:hypothetical protein